MRILIKGGVWKNTEDEILKAAVMKYGKNQWARVASLLNRKSAKQCKARWYEWLDPSIKKTEWSKEEEEKLLHLAKLMPNQWRTIAPIVGRTAGQCMEHYERLLDQAQEGAEEMAMDDPRRLRPGEIDPAPETKPARPDPIDMDEDEKEMLSEARARLANTKGKKAKRKARERQLEESRRLSMLQKRRELKAAGIESKLGGGGGKRKYIDYAKEIPFQKVPPAGFYDVGDELEKSKHMKLDPATHGMELSRMEGRHQKEEEAKERQKDAKKLKALFKANAPQAVMNLSNVNDPTALRKRVPLSLPAPQVSESELEDIVKVGQRSLMPPPEGQIGATQTLIGDYNTTAYAPSTGLSQRTPVREDIVMQEARNLRILREMTPFTAAEDPDGELAELAPGTGFEGVTPRSSRMVTPNVVLQTPSRSGPGSVVGSTPAPASVNGTPMRDQYGLNSSAREEDDTYSMSDSMSVSSYMSSKAKARHTKAVLAAQLSGLPEPEYSYEVSIPEVDEDGDEKGSGGKVEDAADVQLRKQRQIEAEAERELMRRSAVVRRSLPRPPGVNFNLAKSTYQAGVAPEDLVLASSLIGQEMVHMLQYDDYAHPDTSAGSKRKSRPQPVELMPIADEYLEFAKRAVEEEVGNVVGVGPVDAEVFATTWEEIYKQHIYVPVKGGGGRYVAVAEATKTELLASLSTQFNAIKAKIDKDAKKCGKLEQKIQIMTQGYATIAEKLSTAVKKGLEDHDKATIELACFDSLHKSESKAIQRRMAAVKSELENAELMEKRLQNHYASLMAEHKKLVACSNA